MFKTGFIKDSPDPRDRIFAAHPMHLPGSFGVPSSVDFSAAYPPCLTQGNSNTCTSNATANALFYLLRLNNSQVATPQSRLFVYWNGRTLAGIPTSQDTGLSIRDAMRSVSQFNSVPETAWPFDPVTERVFLQPSPEACKLGAIPDSFAYESIPQDELHIKSALAQQRPVVLGILLKESFYSVPDGVATMTGKDVGWHAVAIVGYEDTTRRFKLQNSWGPNWGQNGFFTLPYEYVLDPATASDIWTLKAFTDGNVPEPSIPFTMVIKHDSTTLTPFGSAPGGVKMFQGPGFHWQLLPVGPDTYVVRASTSATPTLLSAGKGGKVDTWARDDSSGRQHFTFTAVNEKKRIFTISVETGLTNPAAKFLTVGPDGALSLQARKPRAAATQQFVCRPP